MYPYLFTFTFLTLMGILTTHTFHKATHESLEPKLEKSLSHIESQVELYRCEAILDSCKAESKPKSNPGITPGEKPKKSSTPPSLDYSKARPPVHSRLNLYPIIQEETPSLHPHFSVLTRLIDLVYDINTLPPSFITRLLKELKEHQETIACFKKPEELSTLQFRDQEIQIAFFHLMKSSLLHYVTLNTEANRTEKKLSFLFVPKELLFALSPSKECYDQLETLREEAWEEIDYLEANRTTIPSDQWKGRSGLKKELSEKYDFLAGRYGKLQPLKKEFDFSLGKKGDVAYVYDTITGKVIRTQL
jgi:hypothetical protein